MIRVGVLVALLVLAAAVPAAAHEHGHDAAAGTGAPPLYDGLGILEHKVTTASAQAQRYFNQGLRLTYAFNHDEAGRAFREAAVLDSNCAMAWWGQALVLGPNINMPMSEDAEKSAYTLAQRALALAPKASEADRAYIEALAKRYDAAPGLYRAAHDSAYADAMRGVMKRFPEDLDAAVLCAEALMDLRPWDFWTLDGKPQPGTLEIMSILEGVLKKNPDHVGALHYYIHTVEASPEPARAEAYADRLAKLTPYAGHLIHMPSHIYMRVGRYEDAQQINARAIAADRDYIQKQKITGMYSVMYYPHNLQMRWYALVSQGRRAESIAAAKELDKAVPDSIIRALPMAESFRCSSYLTRVRFGLWEEILKDAGPPAGMPLMSAAWHYARGMAFAATGRAVQAAAERDSVAAAAAAFPPEAYVSLNPAGPVFQFAAAHLTGEIAARSGKTDDAIRLLTAAVALEDSLRYDEPPQWPQTARQSLGAVLLGAGRAAEAEAVYREDLVHCADSGWSLYGLTQALRMQRKTDEATATEKRFRQAWMKSDVTLMASRY
ncbi:MAG: tetratricopeptide repeat protein [Candidatus Eiseniibacteriota bacterium]